MVTAPGIAKDLPAVDDPLVEAESGFEMIDGVEIFVPPAPEPHAAAHASLGALLVAHRMDGYGVAVEMLTRTSYVDNFAPDASVYPLARTEAGGRQLEELAFEIMNTQRVTSAATKARKLTERGVRRVFAIDLPRMRVLEWSRDTGDWIVLAEAIVDPILAVPLPLTTLLDTTLADEQIVRAMRARRHPEFLAEREEGRVEGRLEGRAEGLLEAQRSSVLAILDARGITTSSLQRDWVLTERSVETLQRWLRTAAVCARTDELFD